MTTQPDTSNVRTLRPDDATGPRPAETPRLLLADIHVHPANPRINAVADEAMVASVGAQGILEPLMVAPAVDGDGWVLIDGHRRHSAAEQALLETVPVNVRYDLVTEAQQIEVMAVTGLQKALLSPVEEAAAYEQLTLLGLDDDAIAAATGFGVRRVRQRRQLSNLSERVKGAVHAGEVTLTDVATLEEFADDHEEYAELEALLGSPRFRMQVDTIRGRRERVAARARVVEEWEAEGAREAVALITGGYALAEPTDPDEKVEGLRSLGYFWGDTKHLDDKAAHPTCLVWVQPPYDYSMPYLACMYPAGHPDYVDPEAARHQASETRQSDWEKQEAARAKQRALEQVAGRARVEWLTDHFARMFPTKSHQALADAARGFLPLVIRDARELYDQNLLGVALDVPRDDAGEATQTMSGFAATLHAATPTSVLRSFDAFLAVVVAEFLATESSWMEDADEVQHHLVLWDWIQAAGYPLSDHDREIRARLESKLLELTTGDDD